MNKLPQFCIGYIRGHAASAVFFESLLKTMLYDQSTWNILRGRIQPQHCAHYFNVGRNTLTTKMLNQWSEECPVLVMLDTDHEWEPTDVMRLVAAVDPTERPIVSALYHAVDERGSQVRPVVLRRRPDGQPETVWDLPGDGLVECDIVGCGMVAIDTGLLLRMRALAGDTWFDFDETDERGDFMPEDNAFCRRAQEMMGARIWVHTGIDIGHEKTVVVRAKDRKRKPAPAVLAGGAS